MTAAAALTSVPAVPGSAQAVPAAGTDRHVGRVEPGRTSCAGAGRREFPVRTRIHGGPDAYDAGGGFRTWYIDLTNTTDATCENIHPVVVLVDGKRALRPEQPRLEFYVGERARPVTFERTDEDEHIGVLGSAGEDGDFAGFTVAPGKTLSVKVRLAVTSDAVANDVVANAAVVQRQEDDGAWVGQSNDYRFRIVGGDTAEGADERRGDTGGTGGTGDTGGRDRQDASDSGSDSDGDGVPDGIPFAEELAGTGLSSIRAILAATAAALLLLGAGAAAVVLARRGRR
ncbi:hypothetical protein ACFYXC_00860 [Streptomyces sp. NPDC002701]|uniref:hypothetical protein n=1 Tax=Streptomyces sp. NPDC002701 TaxID=3364661 RepID=UPI0036CE3BA0